jgi:putative transposase
MSITKNWIHMVFSTKHRKPLLTPTIRKEIFMHIFKNGKKNGLEMDYVNGYYDHCHCLFQLPPIITLSLAAQYLKGESSNWINQTQLTEEYFEWQDEYYAESVSPDRVPNVRQYIINQETHHKHLTLDKEMETLGYTLS